MLDTTKSSLLVNIEELGKVRGSGEVGVDPCTFSKLSSVVGRVPILPVVFVDSASRTEESLLLSVFDEVVTFIIARALPLEIVELIMEACCSDILVLVGFN